MEWNPILTRETRSRWRGDRAFMVLLGYAGLFALALGWSYSRLARPGAVDRAALVGLGHQLFQALTWLQTLGWMLIAPALTATSIAGERERGLLEGLQLSRLTPWHIVWGKLVGAGSFIVLLLLATQPIVATCFLLGGVAPADCLTALGLEFVTATTCAIIGLACSAWSRRASIALRMTFAVLTSWGISSAIAYILAVVLRLPILGATLPWLPAAMRLASYTNPVIAAFLLVAGVYGVPGLASSLPFGLNPWLICLLFQSALSSVLLWAATLALRKPFAEQQWIESKPLFRARRKSKATQLQVVLPTAEAAIVNDSPWWELPLSSLTQFSNPVLQREWRGKLRMRKAPLLAVIFEGLLGLVVLYYYFQALWWAWYDPHTRPIIWWVLALIALIVVGLACAVMGAGAFTREREAETWESLWLSRLTPWQIISGKLGAALLACVFYSLPLWPLLLPCIRSLTFTGGMARGVMLTGISLTQALATGLVFGSMAWCYTIWGMLISWWCRRMATAIGWTLGTLFFLNALLPIFIGLAAGSGAPFEFFRFWHPLVALAFLVDRRHLLPHRSVLGDGLGLATVLGIIGGLLLWHLHRAMSRAWRAG